MDLPTQALQNEIREVLKQYVELPDGVAAK
jgi:4-hydroxy-tetrahydrodipicolinate synthase